MKQEDINTLVVLCSTYGVYEVTKVLREHAIETSNEYIAMGNDEAIIHKDALNLIVACHNMKCSHPLRSKDVIK